MKRFVIDVSVAIKWYIPEPLYGHAVDFLDSLKQPDVQFYAPDLIIPELGNVLWKKVRGNELSSDEAEKITDILCEAFPVMLLDSTLYLKGAMKLALIYGRTIYDSLYLATAIAHEGCLITADHKMVNVLTDAGIMENTIRFLGYVGKRTD